MSQNDIPKIPKIDYIILPFVMALAFYLAFLPHYPDPYPVHIDEWVHLAYFNAVLNSGSTTFIDPFFGEGSYWSQFQSGGWLPPVLGCIPPD
ncbi:hypothetical protein ACFLV4_05945 [Chloroflexota bacterium]